MAINPNCNLIAVVGGKGGVGKSVFAANFACTIMNELRSQVLLIDADAKSVGDQNVIMGLKPQKTLKELASFQGSLNSQPMNTLVTMHQSGLAYLGAVRGPEESLNINPDLLGKLLEFFSRAYKFIIVDVGTDLGPAQMAVLQEATAIMIVTTPEVLVVTQTQRLVNELLSATFPKDMFQLVINKASPTGLSPQTISNQLQLPFLGIIPQDEATSMMSLQKYTPFVISAPKAPVTAAYYDVARKLTGGILQRLKTVARPKPAPAAAASGDAGGTVNTQGMDARTLLKIRIHNELIRTVDLKKLLVDGKQDENKEKEVREKTKREITLIVDREAPDVAREERSKLIKEVLEEALGLGPLEDLLADPDVTEIMVNGNKRVFVEKSGKVQLSPVTFTSNDHLRRIIERIVTPLGRQINDSTPYVDARLKDGSRVNAVIEPLAIDGPALTIRKFKKGGITAEKYIGYGSITKNMIDFLRICVENGLNVVISGGTGSGKTSLLNMLSSFIPSNERVITVEDAAELQLQQEHVVRLETRPASMEGSNAIHIRDLIKNALRMRPDRIIVGECRDGAALDMLQAMNTGHDGSMTTTHANSPRECVARLETLCMMSGMDLPMRAIREQIAGAVNLIVQISRLSDGSRKILSITEVAGMQGDVVTLAEIFRFKETGYDKNRKIQGVFQATGTIPSFIQKLSDKGVVIPREIFANDPNAGTPAAAAPAKPPIPAAMAPKMPGVAPVKKSG
ncbi:ATPase, T2SS/T4P/T4SS family [Bdellovibrio bacteriovorus]|uniref:Pilus assembly protein TadA n=1 Tax=Bdellovibrio bacteriovorus TaxID=959 RepID=A0A1Z3NCU1_BDEBC|nr:ATPase, T2SS/T4P/T4SS family [Bdellovibrio bacteriovorus]ASD65278.1 pilus assembly protein TadA [Bdellovibrio bacteriovorus]